MICETYNWILNVMYWCFGSVRQSENEVSGTRFVVFVVVFVVFVLVISWWLVPLMRAIDKLDSMKFRCEVKKE